jgi:hypothetical protein
MFVFVNALILVLLFGLVFGLPPNYLILSGVVTFFVFVLVGMVRDFRRGEGDYNHQDSPSYRPAPVSVQTEVTEIARRRVREKKALENCGVEKPSGIPSPFERRLDLDDTPSRKPNDRALDLDD